MGRPQRVGALLELCTLGGCKLALRQRVVQLRLRLRELRREFELTLLDLLDVRLEIGGARLQLALAGFECPRPLERSSLAGHEGIGVCRIRLLLLAQLPAVAAVTVSCSRTWPSS